MISRPLTVAWFSYFPVEWLPDLPAALRPLPRQHPAPWQRVLLEELQLSGLFRLHVLILGKQFPEDLTFERNGVAFHCLRTWGGLRAPSLFWYDTLLIRRALKGVAPDLVHAWGTENGAAAVATRLPYPSVISMQGLMSWLGSVIPLNRYHRLTAWVERRSLRRLSLVSAESRFAVDYLRRQFSHLEVHQIEHAPDVMFHRVQRAPQAKPIRLLTVGASTFGKGGDLLLRALDRLRLELDFELVVAGYPEPQLLRLLHTGLSAELRARVLFRDFLAPAEVAQELSKATLFLYPTRGDNSPNSVKEAVVAGVPVVASAMGGIPDYVIPERNGVLFPAGSLPECVAAIRRACQHPRLGSGRVDPDTLAEMRAYLSPQVMGRKFVELYQRAADSRLVDRQATPQPARP